MIMAKESKLDRSCSTKIFNIPAYVQKNKALTFLFFLHGNKTWTLFCALESHLGAFCKRSRQITGYSWQNRRALWDQCSSIIGNYQLRLFRHLAWPLANDPSHQIISCRNNPGWRMLVMALANWPNLSWVEIGPECSMSWRTHVAVNNSICWLFLVNLYFLPVSEET